VQCGSRELSYYTDRQMGQDSGGPPRATPTGTGTVTPRRSALSADVVRAFTDRAPRCRVAMQVLYTVPGETPGSGLIEAELVNVSSSGMLLAGARPLPMGSKVAPMRGAQLFFSEKSEITVPFSVCCS